MEATLVTGANGEVGHALLPELFKLYRRKIITLDLSELDKELKVFVEKEFTGNILDIRFVSKIFKKYDIVEIYHLAAILSASGEKNPPLAHEVNVSGTFNLLNLARKKAEEIGKPVKFIFPSTIAIYGLPDLSTKKRAGKIKEDEFNFPITMYGINKLYCERLGTYFSDYYGLLIESKFKNLLDFRCVRFPGIISAKTVPQGGTSDYLPQMLHAAARGERYVVFVRKDTVIPFMVMPDAVMALIKLSQADRALLTRKVYNVSGFSVSAEEFYKKVCKTFKNFSAKFEVDTGRQRIVDSWPEDLDDQAARRDWQWNPKYDLEKSFHDYLLPEIKSLY